MYSSLFPLWTYAYGAGLLITAFFTDMLGHRTCIACGAVMTLAGHLLSILPPGGDSSLSWFQASQVAIGVGFATQSSFFALMYLLFEEQHYQLVVSCSFVFVCLLFKYQMGMKKG